MEAGIFADRAEKRNLHRQEIRTSTRAHRQGYPAEVRFDQASVASRGALEGRSDRVHHALDDYQRSVVIGLFTGLENLRAQ